MEILRRKNEMLFSREKQKTKRKEENTPGGGAAVFWLNKELGLIYFAFTLNNK
jgi:hypothetical protein